MPSAISAPPPPTVLYTSLQWWIGSGASQVGCPSIDTRYAPTAMPTMPTTPDAMPSTSLSGKPFLSTVGGGCVIGGGCVVGGGCVTGGGCSTRGGGCSMRGGGCSIRGGGCSTRGGGCVIAIASGRGCDASLATARVTAWSASLSVQMSQESSRCPTSRPAASSARSLIA